MVLSKIKRTARHFYEESNKLMIDFVTFAKSMDKNYFNKM
jgi:hypothetical protein